MLRTILLLTFSNIFMTFAWYGHLKNLKAKHVMIAILVSWGIAFFEYCLQVPANRIGSNYLTLSQLKVVQEIITMIVFAVFAAFYMKTPITKNLLFAGLCLVAAAYFIFQDNRP
ncbi:MAG: DMT family protein [Oligoflexia bacterium]|nr:DMT family protein [Oligoflexia bacterium]